MKEYKTLNLPSVNFNPHRGDLTKILDGYAINGWELVSFDWTSWRTAILVRDVRGENTSYSEPTTERSSS